MNKYNHAACAQYWKKFTFALKIINVIDKKQMYDSTIMRKKCFQGLEWKCIIIYDIDISDEF